MTWLRNAHHITRFVLVWFALYLGVAIASPFVNPALTAPHCAAMEAMEKVAAHQNGDAQKSIPKLDCPLCTGVTAPPPTGSITTASTTLRACVPSTTCVTHVVYRPTAKPLARGPPAASRDTFFV